MHLNNNHRQYLNCAVCSILCCIFVLGNFFSAVLAGGGNKQFKAGVKYETAKEWDKAAEEYTLALNEDPGNGEYQLHLIRSLQNASLLFMSQGRALEEQKDYENAYQAFRKAYLFDRTNELAIAKMKNMLEKQGIPFTSRGEADLKQLDQPKKSAPPRKMRRNYRCNYQNQSVEEIIRDIARDYLRLNVVFDQTATGNIQRKIRFELKEDASPAKAMELLLDSNSLTFYRVDARSILIAPRGNPQIQQKYDESMVRTFYIKNGKLEEIHQLVSQMLGQSKPVAENKQLNALTVRDSAENLKIIESLIATVDKPQAEVVLDINIYEVSQIDSLLLGNQIQQEGSGKNAGLSGLGGIGQEVLRQSNLPGLFGPIGLSLALPPSTLSLLQNKGKTKLVAQVQLHSFEGEEAKVNIGDQVPIETGSVPTTTTGGTGGQNTVLARSIQYKDVGLIISLKPKVIDDLVQMNMEIESSAVGVAASKDQALTPPFIKRTVKGVARVRDGQTTLAASVMRTDDSNTRGGLPFISFIPIIGRLFTAPNQKHNATHIAITVTPHILRGGAVTEEEQKISFGPLDFIQSTQGPSYGRQLTLEEIVAEAEAEEQSEAESHIETGNPTTPSTIANTPKKIQPQPNGNTPPVSDGIVRPPSSSNPNNVTPSSSVPNGSTPISIPSSSQTTPPSNPPTKSGNSGNNVGMQPANSQPTAPIPMTVSVSPTTKPPIGQIISVAIIVNGYSAKISSSSIYMHYNSSVLKVMSIHDGGLLQPGTFQSRDDGGQVFIGSTLSQSSTSVPAAGQLAVVEFQVVGAGSADLGMDVMELKGSDSQPIAVSLNSIPAVTTLGTP